MPIYEIINPSDAITFRAADDLTATMAVALISPHYAAKGTCEHDYVGPMFLLGGFNEFCAEHLGGKTPGDWLEDHAFSLAGALDSCLYCKPHEYEALRQLLNSFPEDQRAMAVKVHNDGRRTSVTDIVGRAYHMAKAIRVALVSGQKVFVANKEAAA